MNELRVLIAGIGNIFMGDDGFGVAVAQRLARRTMPVGVVVMDAGIRGLDLSYALMDDWDAAILVDATQRGGSPGTLYLIEPEWSDLSSSEALLDVHGMDPLRALAFARASGSKLRSLHLVGCEPARIAAEDDPQLGLSPSVEAAIEPALSLIERLIGELELMQAGGGHA